ncbi:MAG: hypothetical protein COB24_04165 [Hyphomicrobiales bacterium]|nr:MAG: hypothetical protein COB24_04165 [Hyphomicrobiales bacterium]
MLKKKQYANGQPVHKMVGDILTYFFKTGKDKAYGKYLNEQMQGEWTFYRESKGDENQLWQIGNFVDNVKHGNWKRYSKAGELEYDENFENGKKL